MSIDYKIEAVLAKHRVLVIELALTFRPSSTGKR